MADQSGRGAARRQGGARQGGAGQRLARHPVVVLAGLLYWDDLAWEEAAAMYQAALRHSRRPPLAAHQALAQLYQRLGRSDDAIRESQRIVERDPTAAHHDALIGLYQRLGQCEPAQEQLRAAQRRWPDDAALKARAALLALECRWEDFGFWIGKYRIPF